MRCGSVFPPRCPLPTMGEAAAWSARADRARQLLARGDVAAARREAEAALAAATSDAERGAAHLVLAACCEKTGDAGAALAHASTAVGYLPRDPLARYACAEQQESAGDKPAAIQ